MKKKEFEYCQTEIETDLGRELDQGETLMLRAIYFFCRGLQLLKGLETKNERTYET